MIEVGATAGPYVIVAPLAKGGQGTLFKARHTTLHTYAVIKVLSASYVDAKPQNVDEQRHLNILTQRFIEEAQTASALRHPHVVTVHDCGKLDDGRYYIAMEYLDGHPLTQLWETHGRRMPLGLIVDVIGQAASALAAVHAAGIVHRDLKPDNLIVTRQRHNPNHVTVIDFGIAKAPNNAVTQAGASMGTPDYMAPEQFQDASSVDATADVYSLAAITYQLVCGVRPFEFASTPWLIHGAQMLGPVQNPQKYNPDIPDAWVKVILRAMERERDLRWQSVADFILALAAATPGDELHPDGTTILKLRAPELYAIAPATATLPSGAYAAAEWPGGLPQPRLHGQLPTPPARPTPNTMPGRAVGQLVVTPIASPFARRKRRRWLPLLPLATFLVTVIVSATVLTHGRRPSASDLAAHVTPQVAPSAPIAAAAVASPVRIDAGLPDAASAPDAAPERELVLVPEPIPEAPAPHAHSRPRTHAPAGAPKPPKRTLNPDDVFH